MINYNNALYLNTGTNLNPSLNTIAAPGATNFYFIIFYHKDQCCNGQRTWGTYYGPDVNASFYLLYDLDADEIGIYFTGTDYNMNSSNFFATPGT